MLHDGLHVTTRQYTMVMATWRATWGKTPTKMEWRPGAGRTRRSAPLRPAFSMLAKKSAGPVSLVCHYYRTHRHVAPSLPVVPGVPSPSQQSFATGFSLRTAPPPSIARILSLRNSLCTVQFVLCTRVCACTCRRPSSPSFPSSYSVVRRRVLLLEQALDRDGAR